MTVGIDLDGCLDSVHSVLMMTDAETKLVTKYGAKRIRAMASEARMVLSGAMSAVDSNGKRLPLRYYVAADIVAKGLV